MLNNRICFHCKKIINNSNDYCTLVSHSHEKIVNQDSWHRTCWTQWLDKRIEDKLKLMLNQGMATVKEIMQNNGMTI